ESVTPKRLRSAPSLTVSGTISHSDSPEAVPAISASTAAREMSKPCDFRPGAAQSSVPSNSVRLVAFIRSLQLRAYARRSLALLLPSAKPLTCIQRIIERKVAYAPPQGFGSGKKLLPQRRDAPEHLGLIHFLQQALEEFTRARRVHGGLDAGVEDGLA